MHDLSLGERICNVLLELFEAGGVGEPREGAFVACTPLPVKAEAFEVDTSSFNQG